MECFPASNEILTTKRVRSLINYDFGRRDKKGNSVLHWICTNTSLTAEILRIVIKEEFTVRNSCGNTPLHWLCENPVLTAEMLQIVIDKNFYIPNEHGNTPLHWLCMNKLITAEMIKKVINKDFNVENLEGFTPLHWLCNNLFVTSEILWLFADVDFTSKKNIYRFSPFSSLAKKNNCELNEFIKFLVFPFKLKKSSDVAEFSKWSEFRESQRSITADNFHYLETAVKESTVVLLLSLKRVGVRLPKYLVWETVRLFFD